MALKHKLENVRSPSRCKTGGMRKTPNVVHSKEGVSEVGRKGGSGI